MSDYQVTARNFSEASENRIHSDDVARTLGFRGALVPGVAVYGHLVWPLVDRFGERWLQSACADVRFFKPAYHGDRLTLSLTQTDAQARVVCANQDGTELAVLTHSWQPDEVFASSHWDFVADAPATQREDLTWERIRLFEPFAPFTWQVTPEDNATYTQHVSDETALYATFAHPHGILAMANRALVREFIMPAWIHTASNILHLAPILVNDHIDVQAIPVEKWEKKGHQFIRLHVQFRRDGALTTQVVHTAIFRIAGTQ